MQFENARKSFLDHLQIERGLSSNSIAAYARDLSNFGSFLTSRTLDFEKIDSGIATEFLISLKESGLALSSINRAVSALKTFYKFVSREFSISDPTTEMSANRLPRKLPKALTISEITALLDSTQRIGDLTALPGRQRIRLIHQAYGAVAIFHTGSRGRADGARCQPSPAAGRAQARNPVSSRAAFAHSR